MTAGGTGLAALGAAVIRLARSVREAQDLARIEDVQRIERALDLAHHVDAGTELCFEILHLALTDAVLAGARAVHSDGALGKTLDEPLDFCDLGRVLHVEHRRGVEVAVADMSDDRRDQSRFTNVFLSL